MQNQPQATLADNLLRPFSDTSSYVNLQGLPLELLDGVDGRSTRHPPLRNNAPSTFRAASSSRAEPSEVDSLVRHAEQHAEQLAAIGGASSRFLRRYNKFARLRAEIQLLRSRMQFELTVFADQRRFVTESNESFLREATLIFESLPPAPDYAVERLAALRAQVARDHDRQSDYVKKLFDTETEMNSLEYALQQKEFKLAQAAQRMADTLNQYPLPGRASSQPSTAPTLVDEEELPPQVQYYFETYGEIGIAREKIMELEIDHREERERRIFQAEQEVQLATSDDEFESTFSKRLIEAEMALQEAVRKADNAKQVCIDVNLDPDWYREQRMAGPKDSSDRSISDREEDEAPENFLGANDTPIPTVALYPEHSPSILPEGVLGVAATPSLSMLPLDPPEVVETTSMDPFFAQTPERYIPLAREQSLAEGLSSRRHRQDRPAPFEDRIRSWIDTVSVEAGEPRSNSVTRSKSTEAHSSPIVLEQGEDGTIRVNRAESRSRRQQRRESQQKDNDHLPVSNTRTDERSRYLLKHSSSESHILFLPSWEGTYQNAQDNIRAMVTPRRSAS